MQAQVRRLFVGVFPPPEVINSLETAWMKVGGPFAGVREAGPARWHVTLRFLGPVGPDVHPRLPPLLQNIAHAAKPFSTRFKGVGTFPGKGPPQVIHLAVDDTEGGWELTAQTLTAALTPLGFAPEDKPFRPHLTLARLGRTSRWEEALPAYRAALDGFESPWRVDRIQLIESVLKPGGAEYTALETFTLAG